MVMTINSAGDYWPPYPQWGNYYLPGDYYHIPQYYGQETVTKNGWICPKCNRVYSPHKDACSDCNFNIDIGLEEST